MTALEIGITLPTIGEVETLKGIGGIGKAARHVEELGLDSIWTPDLMIGDGTPALESTIALATAAASTNRIRVGFSVFILPLRPVAWVAAQIQTLQHVSGNRVILGIGSGGFTDTPFWEAVGVSARERGRKTDAALEVLPGLIAGEPTKLEDETDKRGLTLSPAAPTPPILVGGNSEVAIRRAAKYGDGWFPSLIAPDALSSGAKKLRELAAGYGRATPSITVGGHAALGDEESVRSARDALVGSLVGDHGMTPEDAATVPISGGPEEVAERLSAYAEAGAERIVLSLDGGQWMRQCELLAEAQALLE